MVSMYWFGLIIGFFTVWAVLYFTQKISLKKSLIMGFFALIITIIMETYAVYVANLWTYAGGNWPWPLWIAYYTAGMMGYALVEMINKKFKKF